MDIRTRYFNDVAILTVNGRLDSANSHQLLQTIHEQITANYIRLVVDLEHVDYMNRTGVFALMLGAQLTQRLHGNFKIANLQPQVKQALNQAEVNGTIKVYPDVVGATASYFPST